MSRGGHTDLLVVYEDGTEVKVTAQQRDLSRWEREPFGCGSVAARERSPVLFFRYLAWSALWRTRGLPRTDDGRTLTWEQWDETVDYVEPINPPEQDEEEEDELGPTVTAPSPAD